MKRFLSIFIIAFIICGLFSSCGTTDISEFEYIQTENGIAITKYIGTAKKIKIPDNVDGISITAIDNKAFSENEAITSVTLPETIISIGDNAFYGCTSLKKVNFPEGLRIIGESAFSGCYELEKAELPSTVETIYGFAFSFCNSLTNITVSESNPNFTSINGILYNKDCTSLLIYPAGKPENSFDVPDGTVTIGESAFSYCYNLTAVNLPSSVTTLGNYSFYFCRYLLNITVDQTVTALGNSVFDYCESLTISCYENSPIHKYARENGIQVNLINDAPAEGEQAPAQ